MEDNNISDKDSKRFGKFSGHSLYKPKIANVHSQINRCYFTLIHAKGKGLRFEYFWGFWPGLICVRLCIYAHTHKYICIFLYICPLWDTGEAMQSTACAQILSQAGYERTDSSVLATTCLHNTSQGPIGNYLKGCSCANFKFWTSEFRTETLFVCPLIPWHGWLFVRQMYATCKSFPNLSAPPPSTHSAHTLTLQQML